MKSESRTKLTAQRRKKGTQSLRAAVLILSAIGVLALGILLLAGCDMGINSPYLEAIQERIEEDIEASNDEESLVAVTFQSALQTGGTSGTTDSTTLTLTFDVNPATLTVDDVTVTGALKGVLSGSGTTRSLSISNITVADGETVSVTITSPTGYSLAGSPQTAVVYKAATEVTFESAVQTGGTSGTTDSTALTLTFDVDPTTLTADNITVIGATKGALTGSGTSRNLAISDITVADGQTVSVTITSPAKYSLTGSPQTAVVYRYNPVVFQGAEQTGGTSGTIDSTGLTLTFDVDPETLTVDHITVSGATKGALTGTETTRSLAISDITVGNGETVSVAITSPAGYSLTGSPKTATVYRYNPVAFESAIQTGGTSGTVDSTGLTLNFDADPTTLTADNITVTGATKGTLSDIGTSRNLAISDITVADGATVSVAIANPSGYTISGSPKTAVVYRYNVPVEFQSVVQADGMSGRNDSTGLTLTFDVDPTTLTAGNITVSGATKGALNGTGTMRTLAISAITVADGATVSVAIASPSGFTISGSPKTAVVYRLLTIGMAYQGGIIAYILQYGDLGYDKDKTHGLIAATADQSTGIQWYNGSYTLTGAMWEGLGQGQLNTTAIIKNQGAGSYAAQVCDVYTNADTGTGVYTDWYLPSREELNELLENKDAVGGFALEGYWSSSEVDRDQAYSTNFRVDKSNSRRVRAVRFF